MVRRLSKEERLAVAMWRAGRGRDPTPEELAVMVAAREPQPKPRKVARRRRTMVDVGSALLPFGGRNGRN